MLPVSLLLKYPIIDMTDILGRYAPSTLGVRVVFLCRGLKKGYIALDRNSDCFGADDRLNL